MTSEKFKAGQTEQAFLKATRTDDLSAEVRIAREIARRMILNGGIEATDRLRAIDALVGGPFDPKLTNQSGDMWTDYCHRVHAAFAIGIAIGQLVNPDVFKSGGAK